MNTTEVEQFLRQSLADRQFSGRERSAFSDWIDANNLTNQERGVVRHLIFKLAREATVAPGAIELIEWIEQAMKVIAPVDAKPDPARIEPPAAFFSPGEECLNRIIYRLQSSRRAVQICVFTITDDRIKRAILDTHRRGVPIRLISDNEKSQDLGSDIEELRSAGITTKIDTSPAHMHHKFAIFDGARLLNGSYNWTRGAANENEENLIDTGDPEIIHAFTAAFEALWKSL